MGDSSEDLLYFCVSWVVISCIELFRLSHSVDLVLAIVASWLDAESGLKLSLPASFLVGLCWAAFFVAGHFIWVVCSWGGLTC
jgi:hypothetical protein